MIRTFIQQSGKISELRKTVNINGKMYSGEFYTRLCENENKSVIRQLDNNNQAVALFVPECIKVMLSESDELMWKSVEQPPEYEYEFDFQSSLGTFYSKNRGEFGGVLTTPKGALRGNFISLFEVNNKVYAIDSLKHMSIRRTCIYEFDKELNVDIVYKTKSNESMAIASLMIEENRALVLVSGTIRSDNGASKERIPCSYLFEVSEDGFKKITEFDFVFHYVYNMLLIDKKLIVGMDKVVAFADIETREVDFFTPLTIEAENDIRKVI